MMSSDFLMSRESVTRDTRRHVPSKLLPFRQHSVLGGDNINIAGPPFHDGASCDLRLTDNENGHMRVSSDSLISCHSHARDIEDSLRDSYTVMKTKLDEMEEYNRTLELQLGSIFQSINSSVRAKTEQSVTRVTEREPSPIAQEIKRQAPPKDRKRLPPLPELIVPPPKPWESKNRPGRNFDKQTEEQLSANLNLTEDTITSKVYKIGSSPLHSKEYCDSDHLPGRNPDRFSERDDENCPLPSHAQVLNNEEDKNPILQLDGAGHDPVRKCDQVSRKYSSIARKNDDLSNIIRDEQKLIRELSKMTFLIKDYFLLHPNFSGSLESVTSGN